MRDRAFRFSRERLGRLPCGDAEICALEVAGSMLTKVCFEDIANGRDGGTMMPLSLMEMKFRPR
jgi:hypothetical protein